MNEPPATLEHISSMSSLMLFCRKSNLNSILAVFKCLVKPTATFLCMQSEVVRSEKTKNWICHLWKSLLLKPNSSGKVISSWHLEAVDIDSCCIPLIGRPNCSWVKTNSMFQMKNKFMVYAHERTGVIMMVQVSNEIWMKS